jgi:O-antigen ligase
MKIKIIFIVLFLFSSLYKWLPININFTIIFAFLSSLYFFYYIIFDSRNINFNSFKLPIIFFCFFHILYFATSFYTFSNLYYLEKLSKMVLNIYSFFLPLVLFKKIEEHIYFRKILLYLWIFILFILLLLLFTSNFTLFYTDFTDSDFSFPNYMTISVILGTLFYFFRGNNSNLFIIIKLLSLFFIVLLSSKGVILLIILFTFHSISFKNIFFFFKNNFLLLATFIIITIYNYEFLFTRLFSRVYIGDQFINDSSSQERLRYLSSAFELIINHPFFGIGIGAFGIKANQSDSRLSPHNILIEIQLESGLFIFTIFLITILLFTNSFINISKKKINKFTDYITPIIFLFSFDIFSGMIEDLRVDYFWLGLAISYFICLKNDEIINRTSSSSKISQDITN